VYLRTEESEANKNKTLVHAMKVTVVHKLLYVIMLPTDNMNS
jgi:hypothetical protein